MAIEVTMPQLSDTMNEGRILTWLKKEGEQVKRGEALAEVATDKADLEIESFHEGTLLKISAPAGATVRVGSVIATIGESGEVVTAKAAPAAQPQPVVAEQKREAKAEVRSEPTREAPPKAPASPQPAASNQDGDRVKISPLARNFADAHGVQYQALSGSGEGGRIVKRDIERMLGQESAGAESPQPQAAESRTELRQPSSPPQARPFSPGANASTEPLSQMRRTIADRMVESATTIPHFYVTTRLNAGPLLKLKATLKPLPQYENLTLNHLILRAAALAVRAHPRINAYYRDGSLFQPQEINIGIVTAITDGLLIPVIKSCDQLLLADIVGEARGLVQRARSGRPKSNDLTGSTFCVSNMGVHAVESFTAIINPGNGAILAVSSVQDEPVIENGNVTPGKVLRLTLSVDHRIIDGVMAGEFLTELKRLLEEPVLLLA